MPVAVGEFALLFVLPFFLVTSLGLGVLGAELILAAGAFVSGAFARHLVTRIGPAQVVIVGFAHEVTGAAATAIALATDRPGTSVWPCCPAVSPWS